MPKFQQLAARDVALSVVRPGTQPEITAALAAPADNPNALAVRRALAATLNVQSAQALDLILNGYVAESHYGPRDRAALEANPAHVPAGIIELSASGMTPAPNRPVTSVTVRGIEGEEPIDVMWREIFDVQDFRDTSTDGWRMQDVDNTVSFRTYQSGEKIDLETVSGTEVTIYFRDIAGGFKWEENWLRDNQAYRFVRELSSVLPQYLNYLGGLHYGILTAPGLFAVTRKGVIGDSVLRRDILTVNAAQTELFSRQVAKGNRAQPSRLYLVYNPLHGDYQERVTAMLSANVATQIGGTYVGQLNTAVTPIPSLYVAGGTMWLALPKRKLQSGIRQDLEAGEAVELLTRTGYKTFVGRANAARGDVDQVVTLEM